MDIFNIYLILFSFVCSVSYCQSNSYQEKYITLPIDQFSFAVDKEFKMRYLINDTFTKGNQESPILFYCGNEADIEIFAKEIGFIWELAPKINALVVFAEHRYYGKSLPFGLSSMNQREHFGFLTIEQTLADFSALVNHLSLNGSRPRPTIAIGGSYGGILATLFRMKYPHIVAGAIASSAPLKQFSNMTPCDEYSKIITKTFKTAYNEHCSSNIARSWNVLRDVAHQNNGVNVFNEIFNFCEPWNSPSSVESLIFDLVDIYWHMSMTNYPYEAEVYTLLPADPIKKFCSYLDVEYDGQELIKALRQALNVYANPKNDKKCFKIPKNKLMNDNDKNAWSFQRCTELLTGQCDRKETTMFENGGQSFNETISSCVSSYGEGIYKEINKINNHFGLKSLSTASNIIFTNGMLDPWSAASVLVKPNDETIVINIPEGAHHIDLRYSNDLDPPSVTQTRALEELYIKKWIRQFRRKILNFM